MRPSRRMRRIRRSTAARPRRGTPARRRTAAPTDGRLRALLEPVEPVVVEESRRDSVALAMVGVDPIAVQPELIARTKHTESLPQRDVGRLVRERGRGTYELFEVFPRHIEER